MPICKFFAQGYCRFGDNCKFEHASNSNSSRNTPAQRNPFTSSNNNNNNSNNANNRYAALDSRQSSSTRADRDDLPYNITEKGIINDLRDERPQWILSAYGPGLKAPAQLFGGPIREQSFEEMRLQFYLAAAEGNPQPVIQQHDSMYEDAMRQIQTIISDIPGAIRYILDAENTHPNRLDVCASNTQSSAQHNQSNPFGTVSQSTTSTQNPFAQPPQSRSNAGAFGAPSALGQRPNPFGTSSSTLVGGAFGQPSALGRSQSPFGNPPSGTGVFGQSSNGAQSTNAFGATTSNTGGAFGQPSTMGNKPNPFLASSAPQSTFGQQTTMTQVADPFGNTPTKSSNGAFGQASSLGVRPNPFGPATTTNTTSPVTASIQSNPFGNPLNAAATNPFTTSTAQATASNPFISGLAPMSPQPTPGSAFAAPISNPFGNNPAQASQNPFLSAERTPVMRNPLGSASTMTNPLESTRSPFQSNLDTRSQKQRPDNAPFIADQNHTNGSAEHAALNTYASKDNSGRLTMFKGKRVQYRDQVPGIAHRDGTWERIWMPDGAPPYNKTTEMDRESEAYHTPGLQEAYEGALRTGIFEGGIVPLIPPLREWCKWDF